MADDVKFTKLGPFTNMLVGGKQLRLIDGRWIDEDGNEAQVELPASPTLIQPHRGRQTP